MSETSVPAPAKPLQVTPAAGAPRKLDDVLLAMDVVDTLRHRTQIAMDELSVEEREAQLVARLKEIYSAQGIEVPDRILKDGVAALEEQRFVYKPPKPSLGVSLAKLYVSRGRWAPLVLGVVGVALAVGIGWQVLIAGPRAAETQQLPIEIARVAENAKNLATDSDLDARIDTMAVSAQDAAARGDRSAASKTLTALRDIDAQLASAYDIRIVARPGEETGFWRQSEDNPLGMNYYIIVEAIGPGGNTLTVPVRDAETQKSSRVSKWAQRVSKETFDAMAAEKAANSGLIRDDVLGSKLRGELEPRFAKPVAGGAVTQW